MLTLGSGRSMGAIRGMACYTLLRDLRQISNRFLKVAIDRTFLRDDGELAGSPVHLRSNILHLLGHVRRHMRGTMRGQR